jgi:hypothetical protein
VQANRSLHSTDRTIRIPRKYSQSSERLARGCRSPSVLTSNSRNFDPQEKMGRWQRATGPTPASCEDRGGQSFATVR